MITASLPLGFTLLMNKTPLELFEAGGIIMWPILIVIFLAITVVVERMLFIIRENSNREPEVVEKMLERAENRDVEGAIEIGKKSKDFIARSLTYALSHPNSPSNAFTRASKQELNRFNQGMATHD